MKISNSAYFKGPQIFFKHCVFVENIRQSIRTFGNNFPGKFAVLSEVYEFVMWRGNERGFVSLSALGLFAFHLNVSILYCVVHTVCVFFLPFLLSLRRKKVWKEDVINGLQAFTQYRIYWHVKWEMIYSSSKRNFFFCIIEKDGFSRFSVVYNSYFIYVHKEAIRGSYNVEKALRK